MQMFIIFWSTENCFNNDGGTNGNLANKKKRESKRIGNGLDWHFFEHCRDLIFSRLFRTFSIFFNHFGSFESFRNYYLTLLMLKLINLISSFQLWDSKSRFWVPAASLVQKSSWQIEIRSHYLVTNSRILYHSNIIDDIIWM